MMMSCGSASMNTLSVLPRNMPGIFERRRSLCHDSWAFWLGVQRTTSARPMCQLLHGSRQFEFQNVFILSPPHLSHRLPHSYKSRSHISGDLARCSA